MFYSVKNNQITKQTNQKKQIKNPQKKPQPTKKPEMPPCPPTKKIAKKQTKTHPPYTKKENHRNLNPK